MERNFSVKDQKVFARYFHFLKYDKKEIYEKLTAVCGPHAADYNIVKDWVQELDEGRGGEIDEEDTSPDRENEPELVEKSKKSDPEAVGRIEGLLLRDRRLTLENVAEWSNMTDEMAYDIVHSDLGLKRICERWVPRIWTPEQRSYRIEVAKQLCYRWDDEGDSFLKRFICGDVSYIHYYIPKNTVANGPPKSKYHPAVEPVPVRYCFFYDSEGILLFKPIGPNEAINSEFYCSILRNDLQEAIREKRKDKKMDDFSLLHGNNPYVISLKTQKTLEDIGLESLPHPPASPDIEPIEYFLFNSLNSHLKGKTFTTADEVHEAICKYMDSVNVDEYANSINKLVQRWESIIDSRGLYVY